MKRILQRQGQKKNSVFICSITEGAIKVAKCLCRNAHKKEFSDLEVEVIAPDLNDAQITQNLRQAFRKLGYNNNPLIFSLPRHNATCRYVKIPAQKPQELEKIVSLQAARYLPYPANELVTGYQIISQDQEGYAHINLIIVHRDAIGRIIRILQELKIGDFKIVLSSCGLCNLYSYLQPREAHPVIVVDFDINQVEIAIIFQEKLFFSRSVKILQQNWQDKLAEEINRTREAYSKEVSFSEPAKIVVTGPEDKSQEIIGIIEKQINLPVEFLPYWKNLSVAQRFLDKVSQAQNSFASLAGLALKEIPEPLNLMPQDKKEQVKKNVFVRDALRLALYILGIIFIFGLGVVRNMDNKVEYLNKLKKELNDIEKEARPLGELEKRAKLLEGRLKDRPSTLDIINELYRIIPQQVTLTTFSYEKDNQVILRGQAMQMNEIFAFVSLLEKSGVFGNFHIKVRYATKKKTLSGEVADFEIVCTKND